MSQALRQVLFVAFAKENKKLWSATGLFLVNGNFTSVNLFLKLSQITNKIILKGTLSSLIKDLP